MIPKIKKAYFEITNVCNMSCSFCPGTKRKKAFISLEDFRKGIERLEGRVPYLYLHLMGEPTIHPELASILLCAKEKGFNTVITTNGTTLAEKGDVLLGEGKPYKVSISLHSFEANSGAAIQREEYLDACFEFAARAADLDVICVFRLWNLDGEHTRGENSMNDDIMFRMKQYFGENWTQTRGGMKLRDKVFLEYGEKFEWPSPAPDSLSECGRDFFCHGLRDQIGILCDGTVVPCCLDSEGSIPLGNIFESSLDEILSSPRVKKFYESVTSRRCPSVVCENCGYAERFSKNKKK